jgi:hypothetical protein
MPNMDKIDCMRTSLAIEKVLSSTQRYMTAKEIVRGMMGDHYTKSQVNKVLYAQENQKFTRVGVTPPRWGISGILYIVKKPIEVSKVEPSTEYPFTNTSDCIMVDLGNTHGVVEKLSDEYYTTAYNIIAFADRAYNTSKHQGSTIPIVKAQDAHKNAADCWLMYIFFDWCRRAAQPLTFHICTKDQGIHPIREIAEQMGHKVIFYTSWEELRNEIE